MVNVKRYVARTAREALAALKAELGPDAVVLSNRQVPEGVEIVALPPEQLGALNATVREARAPIAVPKPAPVVQAPAASQPMAASSRAPVQRRPTQPASAVQDADTDDFTVTLGQHIARLARENPPALTPRSQAPQSRPVSSASRAGQPPVIRPFNPPRVNEYGEEIPTPAPAPMQRRPAMPAEDMPLRRESMQLASQLQAPVAMPEYSAEHDLQVAALEATNARLMDELSSIKGLLERQLAGFAWGEISRNSPSRTQMMSELLEAGFSAELTRRFTEEIQGELTQAELRTHVKARINRFLPLLDSDADIIDRGGVYALVGPTGVGKTTTTAKLAARCVVRHGADKLALITTDGYRIGAHEQLRIYGRILGVPVHVVRDAADLRRTLQDLRNKHMVLIDTIGVSQRDKMVVEQAAMLNSAGCVRKLLVLNATSRGDTLDDVVRAYEGPDLAGCILSKVDETASIAPVLDVAIRHELQVFYVANGQRVPEDLHLPNRSYLVHRAMKEIAADSPWKLGSDEACLMMSNRTEQQAKRRGASL